MDDQTLSDSPSMLPAYLAGRDVPCPNCEYNLRDLKIERCPECGLAIELRVGLVEPSLGMFLTGVVAFAVSAGFSWLLVAYIGIMRFVRYIPIGNDDSWHLLSVTLLPALISTALLFFWIKARRRLRQASRLQQTLGCLAAWCVPAVNIVVFSFNIR